MPTYISLIRFTDQGLATIKDGPARLADAKRRYQSVGAEMKAFYLTTGAYDAVVIAEAPDDRTQVKLALELGGRGTSLTETLRAFTEEEYRQIIAELS
jgi:uncharacterized protein with GYD domain